MPAPKPKADAYMLESYKIKGRSFYKVKLQIADIIIQIQSKFKGELFKKKDSWRYDNFIHKGSKKDNIILDVRVVDKLPKLNGAKRLFATIHPQSNELNWGLYEKNSQYILKTFLSEKKQHIVLNSTFDKGIIYVPKKKKGDAEWNLGDIIYDALQIILINYLSKRDGIFVHAIGLKDIDGTGRIFIGKSGNGKSTLARLWHKYSRAVILNDDRIIIRKTKKGFLIHGSPWHGDFYDYLISKMGFAKPAEILFIYHSKKNILKPLSQKQTFELLYPNLFPTFWDKKGLNKTISFCLDMMEHFPCYGLGFRNDKNIIGFTRSIK